MNYRLPFVGSRWGLLMVILIYYPKVLPRNRQKGFYGILPRGEGSTFFLKKTTNRI